MLRLKEVQVVWDANQDHLAHIDLEKDENLMAHHEQASLPRVFDPLIAIVANKEVDSVRVCGVGVHEFKTDSDTDT